MEVGNDGGRAQHIYTNTHCHPIVGCRTLQFQTSEQEISAKHTLGHFLDCASDSSGFQGALTRVLNLCFFIWSVHAASVWSFIPASGGLLLACSVRVGCTHMERQSIWTRHSTTLQEGQASRGQRILLLFFLLVYFICFVLVWTVLG